VDVIEAGFAASSNGDFEAVKAIADVIKESTVCSLARANDRDIARAAEALKGAARCAHPHLHRHQPAAHGEEAAHDARPGVRAGGWQSVRFARNLCADVEFSPEDGYRSEPDFLCRVLEAVIAEGATTINIPDTVGYAVPELYGEFIRSCASACPTATRRSGRCTATTTSAWRWPTRWPA
jgi:2-isopropylmalate synthase